MVNLNNDDVTPTFIDDPLITDDEITYYFKKEMRKKIALIPII